VVSFSSFRQVPRWYLKLHHGCFLPHPFVFISTLTSLSFDGAQMVLLKAWLNKPQTNTYISVSSLTIFPPFWI
jgi:hypothetical protein